MTNPDAKRALLELARRAEAAKAAGGVVAGIRKELFPQQLDFIDDPSRNKVALCTRRAGKTSMWSRYCTIVALQHPNSLIRVWGSSRLRVKQLLWREFLDVASRHKIPVASHETELTIRFDNGSEIRLVGADKSKDTERKRGDKTRMEVVLEAQLFGPLLRSLVEDVAEPCLFDVRGTMCLEGTPGFLPAGYWYWVSGDQTSTSRWDSKGMLVSTGGTGREQERLGAGWSCHSWSLIDNPHLPHAREELELLRKKRNWTIDSPTYVREYLGKWVKDEGSLFYKFNDGRNTYRLSDIQPWGEGWSHVLGFDLGSRDDMALGVWGWHHNHRQLYEAAEWKKPGASAEEVVEQIEKWERAGFNFVAKVADTGGGGLMYVEQVMRRTSQVFIPAKKSEKAEHVRLMNDDFMSGRLLVMEGGEYAAELSSLPKDPSWEPTDSKAPGEDPRFANHLCDSFLYSWRHALNYLDFAPDVVESAEDRIEREDVERIIRQTERSDDPLDAPIHEEGW